MECLTPWWSHRYLSILFLRFLIYRWSSRTRRRSSLSILFLRFGGLSYEARAGQTGVYFQFSFWDSWYRQILSDGFISAVGYFQFSFWDSYESIDDPFRLHQVNLSILFLRFILPDTGLPKDAVHLSILFLRFPECFMHSLDHIQGFPFNSLFEIRKSWSKVYEDTGVNTFNSLFEIPLPRKKKKGVSKRKLSILFLRFRAVFRLSRPWFRHSVVRGLVETLFRDSFINIHRSLINLSFFPKQGSFHL